MLKHEIHGDDTDVLIDNGFFDGIEYNDIISITNENHSFKYIESVNEYKLTSFNSSGDIYCKNAVEFEEVVRAYFPVVADTVIESLKTDEYNFPEAFVDVIPLAEMSEWMDS